MKREKLTSATLHTTQQGPYISYTYSVEDTSTGETLQSNIRDGLRLIEGVADMDAAKEHFDAIYDFIRAKRQEKRASELEALKDMMGEV